MTSVEPSSASADDRADAVTRRRLVERTAVLGVALAAPTFLAEGARAAVTRRSASPRKTLRMVGSADFGLKTNLDPGGPTPLYMVRPALYSRLVQPDAKGAPSPDLAVSWSGNAAADQWTFKLRTGVRFHNGRPFTSRDVAYTFRRILDPKTGSPGSGVLSVLDPAGIRTPNKTTVIFKLKVPQADFPTLAMNFSAFIIPEGSGSNIATTGIGTGPFKLRSWNAESTHGVLVANDSYFGGKPRLGAIDMLGIAALAVQANAVGAGQADLIFFSSIGAVAPLRGNSKVAVYERPSGWWRDIALTVDTPPFDDVRVRLAMKLVMDQKQMIQAELQGHGVPAGDNPVRFADAIYRQKSPHTAQNIARAKTLLAQSGHPDGVNVEIWTNPDGLIRATTYQAMAAEARINVKVSQVSDDVYWTDYWLKKPCLVTWGERPTVQVLNEIFRSTAPWNETHWKSPVFDAMLDRAARQLDIKKRAAAYKQAQLNLITQSGTIIPHFSTFVTAMSKKVRPSYVEHDSVPNFVKLNIQ